MSVWRQTCHEVTDKISQCDVTCHEVTDKICQCDVTCHEVTDKICQCDIKHVMKLLIRYVSVTLNMSWSYW